MIADKFVDLYARNAGLRDKLVAERDVVLTYALAMLIDTGVMADLAFKGGTCLRKLVFGSSGRFSEDLDFTLASDHPEDDVLLRLVEAFNRSYHGVTFAFDEYYKTDDDTSFGGEVFYRHDWNDRGRFRLQVSLRERPTLPVTGRPMQAQGYFAQLEFMPPAVRTLAPIEMIAEKVRASFQRAKVRDLYDLHRFATTPFDGELLRRLAVLKLWQVRDPFAPDLFFSRLRDGRYDWEDLRRLLRSSERPEPEEVLRSVETRFAVLRDLTNLEHEVIADAKSGWNEPLADRLRAEIRARFAATMP
ncbi:MAG: nucleotidyl transferase AbiEii/AbiGii toxin family protein [Deltaproteobacteria bacterium]|nr:nucleotidyl transferase AbiEii/AbiGii toxin family protein [Deltaproteobacteria bacterium]